MELSSPFSIELGDFTLASATSLSELLWFIIGLLVLATLTIGVLRQQSRRRPDPFVVPASTVDPLTGRSSTAGTTIKRLRSTAVQSTSSPFTQENAIDD